MKMIKKMFHYLGIILRMHSLAPTKEIKKIWKIIAISGLFIVSLTLFCGEKIFWFLKLPKIDILNTYGSWIFFIFILVFIIVFFDYKKCSEITAKNKQKQPKP
jgi:hypothetical protein